MGPPPLPVIRVDFLQDSHIVVPRGDRLCNGDAADLLKGKHHFRIAHEVPILYAGVGDGDLPQTVWGMADVLDGQEDESFGSDAGFRIGAKKLKKRFGEALIVFHCLFSFQCLPRRYDRGVSIF